jgi:16S rRNA (guanine966-N2)-methyltransferase
MRIIAGKFRGRKLMLEPGKKPRKDNKQGNVPYRPTTDFLRETLFNILGERVIDCCFLDVCAGCGAVGIEALSRGAKNVIFVEKNVLTSGVIKANLEMLKTEGKVYTSDAAGFINSCGEKFDIVFIDPPYFKDMENHLIDAALKSCIAKPGGVIVLQHESSVNLKIKPAESRRYSSNVLSFYYV